MQDKTRNIIRFILKIICLMMIIIPGWILYNYYSQIENNKELVGELKDEITKTPTATATDSDSTEAIIDLAPIYKQNNDLVGWLTIPNTEIDYPVMQTPNDEEYYLRKNFNKEYDINGTLFCKAEADILKPSDNITIYGHHMKANVMFKPLDNYRNEDFYKSHKEIIFYTIDKDNLQTTKNTYEVIAAYTTDVKVGTYPYDEFIDGTEEEFNEFIKNVTSNTPYNIDTSDIKYGDKFISLSTCAYHTSEGRFVIIAKKIK
ncbi:MAG: class B sortase [Bacilli bacterium]|nr:class B sortase [Bacilli bacterium]